MPPRQRRNSVSLRRPLLALMMAALLIATAVFSGSVSVVPTVRAVSTSIVISQVYGGAGCGTAGCSTYKNDYIELFNRGTSPQSLNGWSVQYAAATGTAWQVTALTNVTLQPGQYYLVQEGAGANGVNNIPTPDATGTIAMSATAAKVALVNTTTALTGACPSGASIVDLVGYGATASCFETAVAPAPSTTTADVRGGNGCTETDNNSTDFTATTPNPRNTASTTNVCGGGGGPTISINNVTQAEGNSGPTTFTFTVSLSAPAGPGGVTYNIATADNTATDADNDYEPISLTGENIPEGGTSKMYNVTVNGDTNVEPDESFFVNVTSVTGATPTSVQGTGTIMNDDGSAGALRIHDIQGATHRSPQNGMAVTNVPGIITAKRTAAADGSKGFYLQDPSPDADDATSEGIFVFTTNTTILNSVTVGDSVLVSGTATEFRPGGAASANLSVTEIGGTVTVTPVSAGNPLPAPIIIGTGGRIPPSEVIEDDSAGDVETSNVFDPASDGIDFHESLEHMRVQVNNAVVVGPTADFGTSIPGREVYVVGDNGAHAGVRTSRGGLIIRPNDFNPERIVVTNLFQPLADLDVSDTFTNPIVGVYDYNFGKFLLHATSPLVAASGGLTQEVAALPAANQLTVATFNVENLDPSDGAAQFNLLAGIIVNNLRSPDLLTVEEIQDNNGATNDSVVDADVTFNTLISAIQTAGGPTYQFRQINPVDDQDGGEPGGNIRVGFLFRTDRGLSFIDRPGGTPTSSVSVVSGTGGPELSFSPGRIDPTNPAFNASRKPLAGEFMYNGRKLFVIGNHFNSKGGDDPTFGRRQPPVLSSEAQRIQQAQIVNNFVDSIVAQDAKANVIVLGDINDFYFSAPLNTLKGDVLHALMETLFINERYSYDFQGNSQSLDHILVSDNIFNTIFQYDVVHINAEFAPQASDHDPQVAYLSFIRRNNEFDFDGDDKTGFSVFRPNSDGAGHGRWYILNSGTSTVVEQQFGDATDKIVPADYDGNGTNDIAVFRPSEGAWYISQGSAQAFIRHVWGQNGDVPVPADYDADGKADLAVYRPSNQTWYIRRSSDNTVYSPQWGTSGDQPVPGDYDGDTHADVAVWRPSTGIWYVLNSGDATITGQQWGLQNDVAAPGDYDGDGKTDPAVWRPSTGVWYILKSSDGTVAAPQWGINGDVAVPGDYDGDFQTDVAVWRPSSGTWFVLRSTDGGTTGLHWGSNGDVPVPSAYTRP
ncbi:MAG: lamin tail domain-containing protein [Pyrinomonadaceae bacterium]